jgi:hypothetical protein
VGTPQYRPGGHSPIKPRRPVRRARQAAKHSTSHTTVGTVMQNQPARRTQSMTLSRYVRVADEGAVHSDDYFGSFPM